MVVGSVLNSRTFELQRTRFSAVDGSLRSGSSSPEQIPASRTLDRLTSSLRSSAVRDLLTVGFEALDLLNIGLVVCNPVGEVLVANQTAEDILNKRDGLELTSEGVLSATNDDTDALARLIRQVAESRGEDNGSRDCAFAVRRPSGRRALTLFVRTVTASAGSEADNEATALVMIRDSGLPVEATEAELRQLYGLTSTEAHLANLLMQGLALEDCCDELGIRRTTARMHLRNIFAKTGVRRQSELVVLLLKSIGLGPRLK